MEKRNEILLIIAIIITLALIISTSQFSDFLNKITGKVISENCPSGMVSYWKFENNFQDSAGNNHGTASGAIISAGKLGTGVGFDGVNDYVSVLDSNSLDITNAITMSAWIKVDSFSNQNPRILAKKNAYDLYLNASLRKLEMAVYNQSASRKTVKGSTILSSDIWYHVVGIYDKASGFKLYVNGVQETLTGDTGFRGNIKTGTNLLLIGNFEGLTRYFSGMIDEVAIYNRALTASEISDHYNSGQGKDYCTPSACTDDCSPEGKMECVTSASHKICNRTYDSDSCLEWSSAINCGAGQTCNSTGQCIPSSSICVDSDVNSTYPDGKNYYQKGNATKGTTTKSDVCNNEANMNETICSTETSDPSIVEFNCPNKCEDGKCIPFCTPDNTINCVNKQCGILTNGTCGEVKCGTNNGACPSGQSCNITYQCTSCVPNWRAYNTSCEEDILTTYYLDLNSCNVITNMPENKTNYKDCDANGLIGTLEDINYNLRGKTLSVKIDGEDADDITNYSLGIRTVEIYSDTKKIIEFDWNFNKPLDLYSMYIEKQDPSEKKGYLLIKGIEADKTVWVDKKNSTSTNICIEDNSISTIGDISSSCSQDNEVDISCPSSDDDEYSCNIDGNYFEVAYLSHSGVKEIAAYSPSTCTPDCIGKQCGSNRCGGTCSPGCSSEETCDSAGQCIASTIITTTTCTPDWECGNWSTCENEEQTRTCTDDNACETSSGKPDETQSCTSGSPAWIFIVIIILIILIIATIIVIYLYTRKNKPQQTPQIKFPTIQAPQSNTRFFPPSNQPRFK